MQITLNAIQEIMKLHIKCKYFCNQRNNKASHSNVSISYPKNED